MNGRAWTSQELAVIRRDYPNRPTKLIAMELNRPLSGVYRAANDLGIKKSAEFLATAESGRLRKLTNAGAAYRFPKGHPPANKGLRRPGWASGRMQDTQFKKGQRSGKAAQHYVPVGSLRVNSDGYLDRKVRDDGPPQNRWVGVHRLIWIEANGPIPKGHAVTFKTGRATTELADITLDALELLSRQELMRRNSYHTNYPPAVRQLIQLRGAVQRQINKRAKGLNEKQD